MWRISSAPIRSIWRLPTRRTPPAGSASPRRSPRISSPSGLDVLTTGNHVWDKRELYDYLNRQPRLLRPANYPDGPGSGLVTVKARNGVECAVINLQGRTYMPSTDCPFRKADLLLSQIDPAIKVKIRGFSRRSDQRKNGHGLVSGRPGIGHSRHAHPRADGRHAHPARRHGVPDRLRHDRPLPVGDRRGDRDHFAALPLRHAGAHGGGASRGRSCTR